MSDIIPVAAEMDGSVLRQGLDHIVYVSAVHGAGKSTLIDDLAKTPGRMTYDSKIVVHLEDTNERLMWRVTKYWLDLHRQVGLLRSPREAADPAGFSASSAEPGLVLGDRCVFDNIVYGDAFVRLGWTTPAQLRAHQGLIDALFEVDPACLSDSLLPRKVVYLKPPFESVKENLNRRWQTAPKKWREDDFEYLRAVMDSFEEFYEGEAFKLKPDLQLLTIRSMELDERTSLAESFIRASYPGR